MKGSFADLRTNLMRNEQIRKIQQQQILHLKGNMRVFCRVKPILVNMSMFDSGIIGFPQLATDSDQHMSLELHMPRGGGVTVYNFDQVFLPSSLQKDLFEEIKPFV